MEDLGERGRVQHGGDGIDLHRAPVHAAEAGGRVHPRVGDDHEDARQHAAHRHRPARGQVRPPRDPVPAVEVDAEEHRLGGRRCAATAMSTGMAIPTIAKMMWKPSDIHLRARGEQVTHDWVPW